MSEILEKSNITPVEEETKDEVKSTFDKDIWSIVSDKDPETGLPLSWLEVRDYLVEHGAAKGLHKVFEWYLERMPELDPWCVYLISCSHFTEEELEGTPINRNYKRRLEMKVKKLLKVRAQDSSSHTLDFYRKNAHINV